MVKGANDFRQPLKAISFVERLIASDTFKALFREGMDLVEAAAAYLDDQGRSEAKSLSRTEAVAYASESMRLTTRLMQIASWLLVQRAVNSGEMSPVQAEHEKQKTCLANQSLATSQEVFERLPLRLRELCLLSLRLQERILPLDSLLRNPEAVAKNQAPISEIELQFEKVRIAFKPDAP